MSKIEDYYYQKANIDFLHNKFGKELYVQVSGKKEMNSANATFWAALAPLDRIDISKKSCGWDCMIGTETPGFAGNGDSFVYERRHDYIEQLVHYRDFFGVKPNYVELSEEFRLLNNLYFDVTLNKYYEIAENGECIEVAKIENDDCLFVNLKYLIRYISAKQMALLLFVDIKAEIQGSLEENNLCEFNSELISENNLIYSVSGRKSNFGNYVFSVLTGKKIIFPKSVEECGYWPYNEQKEYLDFIIGCNDCGEEVTFTSNPDKLANAFGKNEGSPDYLTPVFFKKDVLQKYLSKNELYSVVDGRLCCQGLWSIDIDNQNKDFISAYLGDLGTYLPAQEQNHWRGYNILSSNKLSEVKFKRDFLCMFTDPEISDLKFQQEFIYFQKEWHSKYNWYLFLPLSEKDQYNLKTLMLPVLNTQAEFDQLILALVKLLIDSINEKEIVKLLKCSSEMQGSINKLERWFAEIGLQDYEIHIKFLRNLQTLRSSGTGHRKGSNYESISKIYRIGEKKFVDIFDDILNEANMFLRYLQENLIKKG